MVFSNSSVSKMVTRKIRLLSFEILSKRNETKKQKSKIFLSNLNELENRRQTNKIRFATDRRLRATDAFVVHRLCNDLDIIFVKFLRLNLSD